MTNLALGNHQIDLWCVFLRNTADPALQAAYRDLLSPEEIERERQFAHEQSRRQFLVGRALLRTALAQYTGREAARLEFRRNAHGKPSLQPPSDPPLEFNLSRADGLVVCAVALRDALGVDVESDRRRRLDPLELAKRYFAPAEAKALENLSPAEQRAAFLDLWTLKEALLKAIGVGMSANPAELAFSLSADRPPTVSFSRPHAAWPRNWQFARLRLRSRWRAAIAICRPASEKPAIVVREAVPLLHQDAGRLLSETESNCWTL